MESFPPLVETHHDRHVTVPTGGTVVFCTDGVVERTGVDTDQRTSELRRHRATQVLADPDTLVDTVLVRFRTDSRVDVVALAVR